MQHLEQDWRTAGILSQSRPILQESVTRSGRALQVTSGNAQPYNLENIKGEDVKAQAGDLEVTLNIPQHSYPAPPTLRSNAPRNISAAQRLEQRRLHRAHVALRESGASRPGRRGCFNTRKYIEYRRRTRRDTGEDGEPIWPDELEEAFQDALVAIPPMGRRKMAQNAKPCGRNELISIYIQKRTGQLRDRKQVSSHIQVLGNFLKHDPDWIALTKESDRNDSAHHNFYYDSIGDLVNMRNLDGQNGQMFRNQHGLPAYSGSLPFPTGILSSNDFSAKPASLSSLDFVMWVNVPAQENRVEDAFHVYTRMQGNIRLPEKPLEDIHNWRLSYPHLAELIDHSIEPLNCEIILLDASLHLMTDFPPKGSKLGIHVELDFSHSANGLSSQTTPNFAAWSCSTIFYENGEVFHKREAVEPHTSQSATHGRLGTIVRPAFESTCWASLFTQITERRRRSENTGDPSPEAADDQSRQQLRHLTAIQEICAAPIPPASDRRSREQQSRRYYGQSGTRRIAILLWKFRQTRPEEVGTTFAQTLIPPPVDRMATNSPLPIEDLGMPPMILDSVVSGSQEHVGGHQGELHASRIMPLYDGGEWDESALGDQHGFDFFGPTVPSTEAEGDASVLPDMSFNDHLDLREPGASHHGNDADFQGGHIIINPSQYHHAPQHLSSYASVGQEHNAPQSSFNARDIQVSNAASSIFNHHLSHEPHSTDFHWDPSTMENPGTQPSIDGSLRVSDVGGSQHKPRMKSVVEELFPEETGEEGHKMYESEWALQEGERLPSEVVQ